jgi:NADH-quinone oxidoreductase subunit N
MELTGLNALAMLPEILLALGGLLVLLINAFRGETVTGLYRPVTLLAALAVIYTSLLPLGEAGPAMFGAASADALAAAGRIVVAVVLVMIALGAEDYLRSREIARAEFHALMLFAATGMSALASAGDLIVIFLSIEVLSISLYAMAGLLSQRATNREAALKYFLTGSFASGFLLFGMALIFGAAGTTRLAEISPALVENMASSAGSELIAIGGTIMMLVGFLFKVGAVPFHAWAPDVYTGSATPVTAFMSTAAKAAAFAGFCRVILPMTAVADAWVPLLAIVSGLTMLLGNLTALVQTNVKRMLAFSSVAHAGYLLLGVLAAGSAGESLESVMFYMLPYALINVPLFLIAAHVSTNGGGSYHVDDFKGLAKREPLLAALVALLVFALAGIPPLAGFWGKFYVFSSAVRAGHAGLAVLGVLTSVLSVFYYMRLVVFSYFHEGSAKGKPAAGGLMLSVVLASLAIVIIGLWPNLWLNVTQGIGL